MESMTGYTFIEEKTPQFAYTIEIKTLNSKYQEVYINLPRALRFEENEILEKVKSVIKRGKVECTIDISEWLEQREVQLNSELLHSYYSALTEAEKKMKTEKSFSLDPLLAIDGVLLKGRTVISDESHAKLFKTIDSALLKVIKVRKNEGKTVLADITHSLKTIQTNLTEVQKLAKFNSTEQFNKLKKRLADIGVQNSDQSRLYTEIALLADKLDINEEISRLKSHINKFKELQKNDGVVGKQLDFLAQEMFREINTIASKSSISEISHMVVEMKNSIDKIREQCRNIV
jgi:uncharacterized protein (TIGR00255 family)